MNNNTDNQKAAFLERINKPGCPSIKTISEEIGVSKSTLYAWIAADKRKKRGISMTKKLSMRTPLNKLKFVAQTEGMKPDEMAKYCEENGILMSELSSWRDLALSSMELADGGVVAKSTHESAVAKFKAEIKRKDKALAEAAALLLLQKKTSDILGS